MKTQPLSVAAGRSTRPWRRLHAALMPDYNRRATVYWWLMVLLGAGVTLHAVALALARPLEAQIHIVVGCATAMLAGLFPVRIPGSKNSFAAGEVFIMLLLLMQGPEAAALAATCEGFIGAVRSSKRWTSRIISPATAAVSLAATGSLMHMLMQAFNTDTALGQGMLMLSVMACAMANFVVNAVLITLVMHLKRNEALSPKVFLACFGWVGTTYAASAMLAGLLYLAFRATGMGVMVGGVPIMVLLLVMLHYHFRQRESDDDAQRVRVEAAEREAEQSARHLRELQGSEQRFHSAFSHAAIGMVLVSTGGEVLQANPAMCSLLACREDALVGRDFKGFVHVDDAATLASEWLGLLADGAESAVELRCRRADGEMVYVAMHSARFADGNDSAPCLILQAQDITARRDAEARLHHIAYHDGLTSLPNRVRFGACLAAAIERCCNDPTFRFAVMYLDFDRFKLINDTLGHSAGDRFLTLVAQRIRDQVRPGDTIGRLGGDEFAILVENVGEEADTVAMAERLQSALATPYTLDGTEVNSSASIGITFSSVGYTSPGDVLRDADIAMYRAKSAGRARTALFDASLRAQIAEQVDIERDLRRALEQNELKLVYQPIQQLASGAIDSFEALLRWNHPQRGPISPTTFIPIAEESSLIGDLTVWVLNTACRQLWQFEQDRPGLLPRPRVHVNVSGTDVCRPGFVAMVAKALLINGLAPRQLTLEITETTLMKRLDSALDVMGKLRDIGVGLSVDDFGTGYSSLAYLSTLPITSLKIDRSFVQRLQEDAKEGEVVRAVITLGKALGKTVIAEGIETTAQLEQLRALGCELGQGYLLAPPLTPQEAAALLPAPPPSAEEPMPRFRVTSFADAALGVLH